MKSAITEYYVSYGVYYAHLSLETKIVRVYNHSGPEFLCGAVWSNNCVTSPGPELPEAARIGLSKALVEALYM